MFVVIVVLFTRTFSSRLFIILRTHYFAVTCALAILYVVVRRPLRYLRVVHRRSTLPVEGISSSPGHLLLGGGLFPRLTVGRLRDYPLLHGDLNRLYDDDCVVVRQLSSQVDRAPENCVWSRLPLHVVAPHVPSTLRSQLSRFLPSDLLPSRIPVVDLRTLATRLCCVDKCTELFVLLERPADSEVNPFHIDRTAARLAPPPASITSFDTSTPAVMPQAAGNIPVPDIQLCAFDSVKFPPAPLTLTQCAEIVNDWCDSVSGSALHESPCACCGSLSLESQLIILPSDSPLLAVLCRNNDSAVGEPSLPLLCVAGKRHTPGSNRSMWAVCSECHACLARHVVPPLSLYNGRSLGSVPECLQTLTFMEKILVARYRHNRCIVRVDIHAPYKMRANAVVFSQPVSQVLSVLPMPKAELDEIVAVLFTGSVAPTVSDFKRTPVFVRPSYIWEALLWLKRNHSCYGDVLLSPENLHTYSDGEIPVAFFHQHTSEGDPVNTLGVSDSTSPSGTDHDICPLSVHGVTEEDLVSMSFNEQALRALHHLRTGGSILTVGSASSPESIYDNPQLFPGLFPWLYPYGTGGPEEHRDIALPRVRYFRACLLYYDRRFQEDPYFPFIVLNQSQIRESTVGSYVLTERRNFDSVADKILAADPTALSDLITRSKRDGFVRAENAAEQQCFDILSYVDAVAGHVAGSNTQRKYQRNEIRSLIIDEGVPLFFITFAPPPHKNPICLYLCGELIDLSSVITELPPYVVRAAKTSRNPVASARFFHILVQSFLKHVLRIGSGKPGLFGETCAYYGTVEQQGRLALHLHLLLWVKGSCSPAEMRDALLSDQHQFRQRMVAWLESCHKGEFSTGTMSEVATQIKTVRPDIVDDVDDPTSELSRCDPTAQLPSHAPVSTDPRVMAAWSTNMQRETDEIVYRSNRHSPSHKSGCRKTKTSDCRARFPRTVHKDTSVDLDTGALVLKKQEAWINTYSVPMSYLLRCNTDVTCLLSGTMVRAVIAYVTDYITKSSLKTHTMFEVIASVMNGTTIINAGPLSREECARRLLVRIVNGLTAKTEIGGPMACALLLGQPDHYTDRQFKVFFWTSYTRLVATAWQEESGISDNDESTVERVMINPSVSGLIAHRKANDYIFRPREMSSWCVTDFLAFTNVTKLRRQDTVTTSTASAIGARTIYRFLPDHPKYLTHGIQILSASDRYVLDFVGATLPRRDHGDREIYCRTMLTLFTPWRTGLELRAADRTWSDTFDSNTFTPRHLAIMSNMNVLYECREASHDFAALRRAAASLNLGDVERDHQPTLHELRETVNSAVPDHDNVQLLKLVEKACKVTSSSFFADLPKDIQHRSEIRSILMTGSSTNPPSSASPTSSADISASVPFVSSVHDGAYWKGQLNDARKLAMSQRLNPSLMSTLTGIRTGSSDFSVQVVSGIELGDEFDASFGPKVTTLMKFVIHNFSLNEAQTRAFVLIALRVTDARSSPLRMYLGGMGGTGKSRVVNALTAFFAARQEPYRFRVMAPTGSAAALIGGSTYHSLFGFSKVACPLSRGRILSLQEVHTGTDVFLLDEVSMMSVGDLYNLSERMCKIFDSLESFGGKHLIVCGDFGQLPPPAENSKALYSAQVAQSLAGSLVAQKATMGKSLWHMFTTVVILRENMRQRGLSADDIKFREALVNLRFGACTPSDLKLLSTRIAGSNPGQPNITLPQFEEVSIVTAKNAIRDAVIYIRPEIFAAKHSQSLHMFVSLDRFPNTRGSASVSETRRFAVNFQDPVRMSNEIPIELRDLLWNMQPRRTDHVAGRLQLCLNMPVLLKTNQATELGATNGAECTVVGWDAVPYPGVPGAEVLQTLFVLLSHPTHPVNLPNLPTNVIPVTPVPAYFTVVVDEKTSFRICRMQVPVLPNFAMTDFGCQGRTREHNVVDLRDCHTHQSMYTVLSRSSSLLGTLILHPFDPRPACSGMNLELLREFRELEILAAVTESEFAGELPFTTHGQVRSYVITKYQEWKGIHHVPSVVHPALRWDRVATSELQAISPDAAWRILHLPPADTVTPPAHKRHGASQSTTKATKRVKTHSVSLPQTNLPYQSRCVPIGFKWDSRDWSCAYDALFMILANLLTADRVSFAQLPVHPSNEPLRLFQGNLPTCVSEPGGPEGLRDHMRNLLSQTYPSLLPRSGAVLTDLDVLMSCVFPRLQPFARVKWHCTDCNTETFGVDNRFSSCTFVATTDSIHRAESNSMIYSEELIRDLLLDTSLSDTCSLCGSVNTSRSIQFLRQPAFIALELPTGIQPAGHLVISPQLHLSDFDSGTWTLAGCIYLGGSHFTSRYIDIDNQVWSHDGISQSNCAVYAGHLDVVDLTVYDHRRVCTMLYVPIANQSDDSR